MWGFSFFTPKTYFLLMSSRLSSFSRRSFSNFNLPGRLLAGGGGVPRNFKILGVATTTIVAFALVAGNREKLRETFTSSLRIHAEAPLKLATSEPAATTAATNDDGQVDVKKRLFKRGEVWSHKTPETGIWVTYLDGVYDVTEFVAIHPGGARILLAAGRAIDPFWAIFSIHSTPETRELIEGYRIGTLIPIDHDETASSLPQATGLELLFANEPKRDPSLHVHSARPCNAESAMSSLDTFITPNNLFYVRNHLPVPKIEEGDAFKLELEGPGIGDGGSVSFTLGELKKNFKAESVIVTMQCAGNRRKEMHEVKPVKGLQWQGGAISTAVWTGVRLFDVLKAAGYKIPDLSSTDPLPGDVSHVHLNGLEGYGASIPIEKALDPRGDVLIAYEMNGEPIPPDHGFPLRAVIPGYVAARSVKWLSKVVLDSDESLSHWQQRDYKGFSPSADLASSDYSTAQSIQELPVQSAFVINPDKLIKAEENMITVKGYAVAGGGRGINRVDVSADGGKTWKDAILSTPPQPRGRNWAWTKWEVKFPVTQEQKDVQLVCKAVDSSYNTQPEDFNGIYNVRGVLVSAWQRINAKIIK